MTKNIVRNTISMASLTTIVLATIPAQAEIYYGCSSGYQFQTRPDAARCYKPASTEYRSLEPCPQLHVLGVTVGYGLVQDNMSNTDLCVTQLRPLPAGTNATLPTACQSGWSKQVRSGRDRCRRTIPESIVRPGVRRNY